MGSEREVMLWLGWQGYRGSGWLDGAGPNQLPRKHLDWMGSSFEKLISSVSVSREGGRPQLSRQTALKHEQLANEAEGCWGRYLNDVCTGGGGLEKVKVCN